MLSGDNSILERATDAKTKTERQSVVEQARTDVLGYQTENKGGDLDKTQLKTVLDKYFDEVPDLTDMEKDAILNTELNTLAKYGAHTIAVYEIYNGNIKTNEQKMISFTIRESDFYGNHYETYELQCVEGMTWAEWANSSSKPFYSSGSYCGYFGGSLQELILSFNDGDSIDYWDGLMETYLTLEGGSMVQTSDVIKSKNEGGSYLLWQYYDG